MFAKNSLRLGYRGSPPAQSGTHSFHTTTRDLTTTTFPSSASQPSDSTTQNGSNLPNDPDLQDRKELNHVQDKNVYTPPTENITLPVTPDMDIISESLSPQPNVTNSPSPWPRGATPASNPNRDNLHVITTMTNHLIVGSFQNAPADLNTCPLSPQSTTWDKSLILSLADCWATPVQLPAISEKARSGSVNGGSLVPQSTMTSSTLPQPKQQRGCPNDMQYFHESDVAEISYKKGEICSRPYHDTIHDMWDKIAQLGQIIGGSSVPQSNTQLCGVFESIPCITGVSFNDTFWGKLFKDTSWAEVFHDTAWAELFHDTSWIVNFNGPLTQRRTRHQDRRMSSTQRFFGRIIELTLATTASSRQLRTSKKADEKRISIQILSTIGKSARCITTPPGLRCPTILRKPSSSQHFWIRKLQWQLSWQCQEPRRSRLQGSQRSFDAATKQSPGQTNILTAPAFQPYHQIPPGDHYIL